MGCAGSKSGHGAVADNGTGGGGGGKRGKANKAANCAGGYGGVIMVGGNNQKNGAAGNGGGGGGVAAFCPDDETSKAYYEQVMSLRRVAVAQGLLSSQTDHHTTSATNPPHNDNGSAGGPHDGSTAKGSQPRRMTKEDASSHMRPPPRTVTVYQCQPLAGDAAVAKGMYSTVHLARLSVFTGTADEALAAAVPRYAPTRRGGGPGANNSGSGGAAADQSSISFSTDVVSQGSPTSYRDANENAVSPDPHMNGTRANASPPNANVNPTASTVSLKVKLPSVSVTHYIIAVKEIALFGNSSAPVVLEQVRQEVRRWTRLSAYTPRLLHCYQLEHVMSDGSSAAVPEATCAFFEGFNNTVGSTFAAAALSTEPVVEQKKSHSPGAAHLLAGISGRLSNASFHNMQLDSSSGTGGSGAVGAPQKLRLYLEYAKYGTLRGFQVKEMAERFQRQRLHELTARAYMRDVLLALLQLHDAGELQYDVCAKAVFVNKSIQHVYFTFFPAYISDIPTGDLSAVTPSQLGSALGLLDPPLLESPPPPHVADDSTADNRGSRNEPINGSCTPPLVYPQSPAANGAAVPIVTVSSSLQNNANPAGVGNGGSGARFMRNGSLIVHDSSCVNAVSGVDFAVSSGGATGGYERQSGQDNGACSGSPLDAGSCESPTAPQATDTRSRRGLARSGGSAKGRGGGGGSGNYRTGAGALPLHQQASVNSLRTLGTADADAEVSGVAGSSNVDRVRRLHDAYCRYLDEFDFKRMDDNEYIPFPSPHDGVGAQDDAEMLASTVLAEEPRETPPMRVVPLQRSSLGGIAILSPDHFVVKPVAAPVLDRRGRLPILLTPEMCRAAFVCGSPEYQRQVTAEWPPSSAIAPATGSTSSQPQHTLSAGTSTCDAAGPLGRARGGVPLVKLNHSAMLRRALNFGDNDRLEDVPVHKYITVTHAAPEVLHRRTFSAASDVYAFAMTFIELVTDDGAIMGDCIPTDRTKPVTRREKDAYDAELTQRLDKWYQARLNALRQHYDAVATEQELPELLSPRTGPVVVPIPPHLSDECKNMLRWCLQSDPAKRPTAAELLRSRYFMLGDWIAAPSVVAMERKATQLPESPWVSSVTFDMAASAAGLPLLRQR